MKGKELDQSRNKLRAPLWMVMAVCIAFTGCMRWGQPLLSRAVIQYDSNVLKSDKELLLLNIVRMHGDQPPHFTASSAITASFSFSSSGGLGSSPGTFWSTDSGGNQVGLTLTATTTNSPTISIAPMQGKEFAQRLLKPMDIAVANMILFQKAQEIDKLLRLIGHSFQMIGPNNAEGVVDYPEKVVNYLKKCFGEGKDKGKDCLLVNRPPKKCEEEESAEKRLTDKERYELFRQVVLHIKAVQMSRRLKFYPLDFEQDIEETFTAEIPTIKDITDALDKKYRLKETACVDKTCKEVKFAKHYPVLALTDFPLDKSKKTALETILKKIAKHLELSDYINLDQSVVIVWFKGDEKNPESNWPIFGLFRLRNFRQTLQFLAESLKDDQCGYEIELNVDPSPFTKALAAEYNLKPIDNPPLTLKISSQSRTVLIPLPSLPDRLVDIDYDGKIFWIPSQQDQTDANSQIKGWVNLHPLRWDRQVFEMLYEIFQMNRIEPSVSPPSLTLPAR
jgi:hypothetical protein